ncbi:C2D1A protein, partial [Anseranas semipalmata]|nr:C2D1A protein [Anseranas semipalmata]
QLGLLVDLSPDGTAGDEAGDDAGELEAELLALVGDPAAPKGKPQGKAPLPMEAIERMAALCMKDLDEEEGDDGDDEDLENEDDLLVKRGLRSLREGRRFSQNGRGSAAGSPASPPVGPPALFLLPQADEAPPEPRGLEATLAERVGMYRTAVANAREAGDGSKVRRYERGLKTLENMLASVRKGKKIDEEEIPPPVALGKSTSAQQPAAASPQPPVLLKPQVLPSAASPVSSPEENTAAAPPGSGGAGTEALLQGRQREYKLAALRAKQQGDLEMATKLFRLAKSFDSLLEAVGKGQPVELSHVPPPPVAPYGKGKALEAFLLLSPQADVPPPPRDALEALQQRMERYKSAAAQAKGKGDDRKARMHERIVKQYQDAIRAHKAGKAVDFSELPVPPGFQPIQGAETPSGDQSIAGVLETALKLANQEVHENEEEDDDEEAKKVGIWGQLGTLCLTPAEPRSGEHSASRPAAQQQLTFLEGRKKQLMQAALRAKQKNDIEGAKLFLRQAKGLEPMIEASQNGLPVDITKVPEAPVNKEDFVLVQRRGVHISPEATSQYMELMKLISQQHEMCMNYSKQFTHLGNITETTKFEKMAEDCKQNMEILKQAHARGFPLPKYHYEQRTFSVIKIFPELNSNDMVLSIVKGINLPAPPGVAPNDLDAFVRFEFPYPNAEEAQKDKTNVIKNTDSPEFKEQFKLYINRGHRGLKRVIQAKGIKFEVAHKGGLFKTDRVIGTAQLKLEALETTCEVREIIELLDGRRPTGGKLEVIVRIREPLGSQQLETRTERWLVI